MLMSQSFSILRFFEKRAQTSSYITSIEDGAGAVFIRLRALFKTGLSVPHAFALNFVHRFPDIKDRSDFRIACVIILLLFFVLGKKEINNRS